jgi:tetratricopeptide (TPR) repeat protein
VKHKLLAAVLGTLTILLILELSLRLGGAVFSAVQNSRNRIALGKGESIRIVCTGESTTAMGGEDGYPAQLEKILNSSGRGKFSVVNAGLVGADTSRILAAMESELPRYRPQILVAMMGANDGNENVPCIITSATVPPSPWDFLRIFKFSRLLMMSRTRDAAGMEPPGGVFVNQIQPPESRAASAKGLEKPLPPEAEKFLRKGEEHFFQMRYADAEAAFTEATKKWPEYGQTWMHMAMLRAMQRDFRNAHICATKALELNPSSPGSLAIMGRILLTEGNYEEAARLFEKAITLAPYDTNVWINIGYCIDSGFREHIPGTVVDERKRVVKAAEVFRKIFALVPQHSILFPKLLDFYESQRSYDDAEAMIRKVEEIGCTERKEIVFGRISQYYQARGNMERARRFAGEIRRDNTLLSYPAITKENYMRLKGMLDSQGIRLVCVQYPRRHIEPLKNLFENQSGIVFVDSWNSIEEAVKKHGYAAVFTDNCYGDFGHATRLGNSILAQNIADAILRECIR